MFINRHLVTIEPRFYLESLPRVHDDDIQPQDDGTHKNCRICGFEYDSYDAPVKTPCCEQLFGRTCLIKLIVNRDNVECLHCKKPLIPDKDTVDPENRRDLLLTDDVPKYGRIWEPQLVHMGQEWATLHGIDLIWRLYAEDIEIQWRKDFERLWDYDEHDFMEWVEPHQIRRFRRVSVLWESVVWHLAPQDRVSFEEEFQIRYNTTGMRLAAHTEWEVNRVDARNE